MLEMQWDWGLRGRMLSTSQDRVQIGFCAPLEYRLQPARAIRRLGKLVRGIALLFVETDQRADAPGLGQDGGPLGLVGGLRETGAQLFELLFARATSTKLPRAFNRSHCVAFPRRDNRANL